MEVGSRRASRIWIGLVIGLVPHNQLQPAFRFAAARVTAVS
jgi:hypothetical protein